MEQLLQKLGLQPFKPLPFLKTPYLQTIVGAAWPQIPDPGTAELRRVTLESDSPDALDATLVAVDRPVAWKSGERAILMVHGLSGDHLSTYMVRLARRFVDEGYLVVRMNLRNAGAALGLSRKTYHAGLTTDARAVLNWMRDEFSPGAVTGIGFSLGGNLLLKCAAEDAAATGFANLMVVSPAVDLESASRLLSVYPGSLIAKFFIRQLMQDVDYLKSVYPELSKLKFPKRMSLRDFDDVHTSIVHGFRDAGDYYAKCSSLAEIPNITVPTLIVGSKDDPVVDLNGLSKLELPAHIDLILTEYGGHVGYLGFGKTRAQTRWSDDVLVAWLAALPAH